MESMHILFDMNLLLYIIWFPLQIATIELAADENPVGVVLGGILYVSLRICISNDGFSVYT